MLKTIFVTAFLLLGCELSQAQTKDAEIKKLVTNLHDMNRFNGTILVAEKGKILYEDSFGVQDFKTQKKNSLQSRFRIYSVTKNFTATMILILQQQGKLSLDDRLSKYYPNFPKGDSITIEHLLTHTSGIPEGANQEKTQTEEILMKFLSEQPLDFSPGTKWNYSNPNYYILGYIINKVTGMPYGKAFQKYIFDPLGMKNTGADFKEMQHPTKTTGYEYLSPSHYREAVIYDYNHPHAAGAL